MALICAGARLCATARPAWTAPRPPL